MAQGNTFLKLFFCFFNYMYSCSGLNTQKYLVMAQFSTGFDVSLLWVQLVTYFRVSRAW